MTGKKQQIEREELRGARPIMIRALSILAAIAALAVLAAPVASAGPDILKDSMVSGFHVKAAPPKPPGVLDNNAATDDLWLGAKTSSAKGHRPKKGHRPNKAHGTVTAMWDVTSNKG